MRFSPESVVDVDAIHLDFFDYCLKKTKPSFDFPRARVYLMGSNQWRDYDTYPPKEMTPRSLFLASAGAANTLGGNGRLAWDPPAESPPDHFTYDPEHPVPAGIGGTAQAVDHRAIERRDDVLVYSSDVLGDAIDIVGPISVVLHAASDARDTDFTAKLLDVYPDGRAVKLGWWDAAVIRARYRNGYEREELLTPGKTEEYTIDLGHVGHTFLAGHRIRVEISSSAYPFIAPNANTGNPIATDTASRVAKQTVFHDRTRPSRLVLPVVPRKVVP
jgi:putative CocE/NonD family hydrolase